MLHLDFLGCFKAEMVTISNILHHQSCFFQSHKTETDFQKKKKKKETHCLDKSS